MTHYRHENLNLKRDDNRRNQMDESLMCRLPVHRTQDQNRDDDLSLYWNSFGGFRKSRNEEIEIVLSILTY